MADCIKDNIVVYIEGLGLSQGVSGIEAWEVEFTVPDDATPGVYPIGITAECSFADGSVTVVAATNNSTTTSTAAPTTTTAAPPAAKAAVTARPAFTG